MPKKSLRNKMKILRGSRARFTMRPTKIPTLMTERDTNPKSMYPEDLEGIQDLKEYPETVCRGGSVIISPLGDVLEGPLYNREGILYADLDLAMTHPDLGLTALRYIVLDSVSIHSSSPSLTKPRIRIL
jgi:predicted amidohydrolase